MTLIRHVIKVRETAKTEESACVLSTIHGIFSGTSYRVKSVVGLSDEFPSRQKFILDRVEEEKSDAGKSDN